MSEHNESLKEQYPTTLDVVIFRGRQLQVIGSARSEDPPKRFFMVRDTQSGETFRIYGASFLPLSQGKPGEGAVEKREEYVGVTGILSGGKIEIDE